MTETLKLNIQQFNVFRLSKFLEKKGVPLVPRLVGTRRKTYGE